MIDCHRRPNNRPSKRAQGAVSIASCWCSPWSADLDSDAKKNGITDPMVTLSPPTRIERNGDRAYVVVPAVYSFKQRGTAMREAAQMTFVLKRGAGAGSWLIDGWTWTGPKPQPAAAPAKK